MFTSINFTGCLSITKPRTEAHELVPDGTSAFNFRGALHWPFTPRTPRTPCDATPPHHVTDPSLRPRHCSPLAPQASRTARPWCNTEHTTATHQHCGTQQLGLRGTLHGILPIGLVLKQAHSALTDKYDMPQRLILGSAWFSDNESPAAGAGVAKGAIVPTSTSWHLNWSKESTDARSP